jgi:hypothetical protein
VTHLYSGRRGAHKRVDSAVCDNRSTSTYRINVATVLALRLRQITENLEKVRSNGIKDDLSNGGDLK